LPLTLRETLTAMLPPGEFVEIGNLGDVHPSQANHPRQCCGAAKKTRQGAESVPKGMRQSRPLNLQFP
jgi:hypothetical protein